MSILTKKDLKVIRGAFKSLEFDGKKYTVVDGISSESKTTYDENGNRTSILFVDKCGDNTKVRTNYHYNENGNIIKVEKTILQSGGKINYKNKPIVVIENKYDDNGKLIEAHNSEYDMTTELSNDGIITVTILMKDGKSKTVQLQNYETGEIISTMRYINNNGNWYKMEGVAYSNNSDGTRSVIANYYNENGDLINKNIETYKDDYIIRLESYNGNGDLTLHSEMQYDIHPVTGEQILVKDTVTRNGKTETIIYDYHDNGKIRKSYNKETGDQYKIGLIEKDDVYHYIDYDERIEIYSNDEIDEVITNNEIGSIFSFQFKKFKDTTCSFCKFDNNAYEEKILTNILEYEFTDTENCYRIEAYTENNQFLVKKIYYIDNECTKEDVVNFVKLTNDPSIYLEYFSKFCQFVGVDFDKKGYHPLLNPFN